VPESEEAENWIGIVKGVFGTNSGEELRNARDQQDGGKRD
jgi:hypothetical protein